MELHISEDHLHKLLSAGNGSTALLYLYLHGGGTPDRAADALSLKKAELDCSLATLRQLGLWEEAPVKVIRREESPRYSETDVISAMQGDRDFHRLYEEVQRLLGRTLNTEELKILLGFVRYLGLPGDVISVLICYCKDRARQKGSRAPSLRTIEKEAYAWAEQGIDTLEAAALYIQNRNEQNSRMAQLARLLQIHGRRLTAAEEKYAANWLTWGFADDAIALAYERTCLNTGGLNWVYMDRILTRWREAGLHTADDIRKKDKKSTPKGASGKLGDAELEAIRSVLQEE